MSISICRPHPYRCLRTPVWHTRQGYAVNVVTSFGESLGSRLFHYVHELVHYIKQFERISWSYYSVQTSKANSSGDKTFIMYQCRREGFAGRPNDGKPRRLSDHTQCEAYFNVGRLGNSFRITRFNMLHNHDFLGAEAPRWFNRNRRLLPEELEAIRSMLECQSRSFNIRFYVRSKFGKYLTNSDVGNIRVQHMIGRGNPSKSYCRRLHSRSRTRKCQCLRNAGN
ncbi:hypothetical protein CLF_112127 [Clonorchis sinensis]|uniref:FAR1 domain-containing protein n=1 Tax=Clonorchis sinensis TaxID=79923 RepID=H2KT70_CLOSI|nr:hypothetical protein CLF_112127 [Clonorchis sinensis]